MSDAFQDLYYKAVRELAKDLKSDRDVVQHLAGMTYGINSGVYIESILHDAAVTALKAMGYRYVHGPNWPLDLRGADVTHRSWAADIIVRIGSAWLSVHTADVSTPVPVPKRGGASW